MADLQMDTMAVNALGIEIGRWAGDLDSARQSLAYSFTAGSDCAGGLEAAVTDVVGAAQAALTSLAQDAAALGQLDQLVAIEFQTREDELAGDVPRTGIPK